MTALDNLMKLREAATPWPWKTMCHTTCYGDCVEAVGDVDGDMIVNTAETALDEHANAAYIVAACNAVPELVARIRELEEQRDWLAQAAANAGWQGVRVGKEDMIDQARIAVSRAQAEQHECPTPEVSCHARDGKLCMSDNHLACAQAADKDSFIMRSFTEVK